MPLAQTEAAAQSRRHRAAEQTLTQTQPCRLGDWASGKREPDSSIRVSVNEQEAGLGEGSRMRQEMLRINKADEARPQPCGFHQRTDFWQSLAVFKAQTGFPATGGSRAQERKANTGRAVPGI